MINPHWLVHNSNKEEIPCNLVILKLFNIWKNLLIKNNKKSEDELDAFTTGYILGVNETLKRKFLEESKETKIDTRVWGQNII